jgi:Ca-activated chloride channel family protein
MTARSLAFLLVTFFVTSTTLAADAPPRTGSITGTVVSGSAARPIANAQVTATPGNRTARTDGDGKFALTGLPAGQIALTVKHANFAPASVRVTVEAGKTAVVSVQLTATVNAAKPDTKPADKPSPPAPVAPVRERKVAAESRMELHAIGGSSGGYGAAQGASVGFARMAAPSPRLAVMQPLAAEKEFNREGYDPIDESSFHTVKDQPLSTLSIDVDTASYSNVRRLIAAGTKPPKDAVRIEELINYFPYAYPGPSGDEPFAVHAEVSNAPWNPGHRLVSVGIQGRRIDMANVPPARLVFLIDVSGSMNSPDKLPLLQQSLTMLTRSLRSVDQVAIVVYAGAAGLVLPPTPGSNQTAILNAIHNLQAGGATAGGAGIQLAYDTAQRQFAKGAANRVILCTDGDFNVGVSSDGELVDLIEQKRKTGVFLTVVAFGTGNYQDAKMQKLADKGNGHHAYVDTLIEARKVFVQQLGGTLLTIAKDVKIQVEFNPAQVKGYRLIGYENRLLAARDFNDDQKDAGELGAGHAVTALYEIVPQGSPEPLKGADRLKYQQAQLTEAAAAGDLMTVKLRWKKPDGDKSTLLERPVHDAGGTYANASQEFRFAAAVAAWGLVLRDSPFKGSATFARVGEWARAAVGPDTDGHRQEFVSLVARSAELAGKP